MSQGGAGEFPGRMTAGTQREDTSSVILQLSITLHTSWMLSQPHPHPGSRQRTPTPRPLTIVFHPFSEI